jgi:PAS domain S-box-containing protein
VRTPHADSAEDLFEQAPCGYLATTPDGTILRVNRTFEQWTGLRREDLVGRRRFQELLTAGGRIYHETHCAPLLAMQGAIREIAVDIVCADGARLPALVNSVLHHDAEGCPEVVRTTVFDATDRRRYEEELLRGRERERHIAVELQRSMLPGALPEIDGVELGVTYQPAIRGLEIGGDWYDAFRLEDGGLGIVVGDVVGRGIHAAAAMGQLRSAFRALASTGLAPGALLEAMDGFSRRHDVGGLATIVYACVDLDSGRVRYACAGHLPPLIAEPGRLPRLLWEGRSLPLDAVDDRVPRPEAPCTLEEGAMLVLYSDGLVERRDRSLDEGLEELVDAVECYRDRPVAELTDALAAELTRPGEQSDDVCVLAIRRTG